MAGLFKKFSFGLKKSRDKMSHAIDEMLDSFDTFEDDLFVELEEILVMADVGVTTAEEIVQRLKDNVFKKNLHRRKLEILRKNVVSLCSQVLQRVPVHTFCTGDCNHQPSVF